MNPVHSSENDAAILTIERPHPDLFKYYCISLLVFPPLLPIFILPLWFRYHTMRYTFTDEGISMRWGILFRREIIVNYARIQDIHLRSNIVERWFGLARVLVQTASGNSGAELTLEGLKQFEAVRDFLYTRMRGVQDQVRSPAEPVADHAGGAHNSAGNSELAAVLRQVVEELRATRRAVEERRDAKHETRDV